MTVNKSTELNIANSNGINNVNFNDDDEYSFGIVKQTQTKPFANAGTLTGPSYFGVIQKRLEDTHKVIQDLRAEIAAQPKSPIVTNDPSYAEGQQIFRTGFKLLQGTDIEGLDIDSLIFLIQAQRAKNLESQIVNIAVEIKNKNAQIEAYNTALTDINTFNQLFPKDADDKTIVNRTEINKDPAKKAIYDAYEKKYYANPALYDSIFNSTGAPTRITKGSIETARASVKGKIDSLSNNSQLDMVSLQTYMGRRNEAFEIISTTVKKMQDSRSGILQRT